MFIGVCDPNVMYFTLLQAGEFCARIGSITSTDGPRKVILKNLARGFDDMEGALTWTSFSASSCGPHALLTQLPGLHFADIGIGVLSGHDDVLAQYRDHGPCAAREEEGCCAHLW